MSDISTKYLGLELENPIIVASGPLTGDLEHLKACQEAGAAVGRSTVNFVISGVLYAGLELNTSVTAEKVC